jgi:protein-S-isoprenylcysteine O-methyltransferase Ste14
MSAESHAFATLTEIVLAAVTLIALLFIAAPYGRHARTGWGPQINNRLGWVLMESPAVIVFGAIYFFGPRRFELVPLCFLAMWWFHYINRTFVFPMRLPANGKRMPVLVAALAIGFNVLNAYVNAGWIGHLGVYDRSWLADPRFIVGVLLFFTGFLINHRADMKLLSLRKPGETGYKIPRGGFYELVSSPNYFGEILEWCGWAIATWSLAGLAFALYTFANLAPRALQHHRWYKERFADYPRRRRALIPYVL